MPLRLIHGLLLSALLVAATAPSRADETSEEPLTGKQLYQRSCQRCHGVDGKGSSREVVGFDLPFPDFTDCSFSSREPAPDWVAVAHSGGPVRVFDRMMPAFGEALSVAELERVVDYVKDFCEARDHWPPGTLNLPRAFFTSKAFVEDEAVVATTARAGGDNEVETTFIYETRVGARGQVELVLPFVFHEKGDGSSDWGGGIGDMKLATKWVLLHSGSAGSILSAGVEAVLPTGRVDRGTGKEVWLFEPFLAYGQLLPLDGFVQLQVGGELSTEPDQAGHEAFWRLAAGMTFAGDGGFGRAWSPMVEVLGGVELEETASPEWQVAPQLQVSLSRRQHVLLSVGALIPVSDFDADRIAGMIYLLWDWFDGPFLEGWR
jgi:mono/diheme cytochrome c family protein